MQLLKEAPSVSTHGTQVDSHHPTLSLPGPSSSPTSPLGFPHPIHSQSRFSLAESQISCSIKPFIPSTVTQPQPEPASVRRDSTKAFIPGFLSLHSLSTGKLWLFFLSPGLPPQLWMFLTQLCHRSSDPLPCKGSQVTSSCPLGSHPELNLQFTNQATCTRCVPQHKQNAWWLLGFKQEAKALSTGHTFQERKREGNTKVCKCLRESHSRQQFFKLAGQFNSLKTKAAEN